jgi:serine/threonine protein kinase
MGLFGGKSKGGAAQPPQPPPPPLAAAPPDDATRVVLGAYEPTLIASATLFGRPLARVLPGASDATVVGAASPQLVAQEPPLETLARGAVLNGKYEILKPLARGGFSYVYLGQNSRNGSLVAIKEACPPRGFRLTDGSIRSAGTTAAKYREILISETVAIARASHPGVVGIEDAFEANGTFYLVLEYVEGESLAHMLERRGKLSPPTVKELAGRILAALAHIHAMDMLHGDIKPSNIFVRPGLQPVIIDFGTAVRLSDARYATPMVSPGYSAPERFGGQDQLGSWSDIYSLGATLAELLTGRKPDGTTADAEAASTIEDVAFASGVRAALSPKPEDRPQTIEEFSRALGLESAPAASGAIATAEAAPAHSLFVSYSRRDAAQVEPLVRSLQVRGINVWIDRQDIQPGQAWAREIVRGLRSARVFLLFCSKNSMSSDNVQNEVYLANQERKPIVAALLDDSPFSDDVALFLTKAQHLDVRQPDADIFLRDVTSLLNAAP